VTAAARQPKYLRIHADLRRRITAGEWPPGAALPAQRELSEAYQVTIMTLRQALQLLEDDGLIQSRHGQGTFVAPAGYAYELGPLRSFTQDLAAQGAQLQTRVLALRPVVPPPEVAARLGVPERGQALLVRRLRLLDGRPLILQSSYLPPELEHRIGREELARRSLYALLADAGRRVSRATETVRPVLLDPADARALHRAAGAPALHSHRLSFTDRDEPLLDDEALLPGDAVDITADRRADAVRLSYRLRPPDAP
jgi:GntR family transcriptional regulator